MSLEESPTLAKRKLLAGGGVFAFAVLITLGVFASNGWLPKTDPMTGRKTGWFGKELPKNASSSWNPLAAPLPTPTPQLSKEYIYAGSRLLAVEDANATAAPPADIAVWRPSNGTWYVMGQQGSQAATFQFGLEGDKPVPGDFDGDGKTDFSVFRPSSHLWYIWRSSTNDYYTWDFGAASDLPTQADFDGDGKTDTTIFRPETNGTGTFWVWKSSVNTYEAVSWGFSTDIPGPADFDGDGRADFAVYRPSDQNYYSINSSNGQVQIIPMGQSVTCSIPYQCVVPSDYDGDGRADFAIYNSSTATWHIRSSTTGQVTATQWGASGDTAVQNDYDLDGKTDLAVWKGTTCNAIWSIKKSSNNQTRTEYFGCPGDIPVPAFYRR